MRAIHRTVRLLLAGAVLAALGGSVAAGAAGGPDDATVAFSYTDPEIVESSGLISRDGLFVTVNDSGDSARIFTVDPATGDTVGTTSWGADADDIEALAPAGDGDVWVGDIGDNTASRDDVEVSRVPFGRGDLDVDAATFHLSYPDGPHDAETLLADPRTGRLLVVAKEFIGRLYAAPEELDADGANRMTEVGQVLGIATDGAFFPDGDHLVIRNYGQAAFYTWPTLDRIATLTLPSQPQGEAIAVDEQDRVFIGTEGSFTDVLQVQLPPDLRAQLDAPTPTDAPADGSTPQQPTDGGGIGVAVEEDSDLWWWLGGGIGVLMLVILLRSLRPR